MQLIVCQCVYLRVYIREGNRVWRSRRRKANQQVGHHHVGVELVPDKKKKKGGTALGNVLEGQAHANPL